MKKRYKLTWCDVTEYTITVDASSIEQARDIFERCAYNASPEPTGWVEMEPDSLEITEEPSL